MNFLKKIDSLQSPKIAEVVDEGSGEEEEEDEEGSDEEPIMDLLNFEHEEWVQHLLGNDEVGVAARKCRKEYLFDQKERLQMLEDAHQHLGNACWRA